MDDTDEAPDSSGERLLFALGQLYRLHRQGVLLMEPAAIDVLEVARVIGVARDIEFVSQGP